MKIIPTSLFTAAELALIYEVFSAEKMAFNGKVHAELHGIMTKLPLMHAEASPPTGTVKD